MQALGWMEAMLVFRVPGVVRIGSCVSVVSLAPFLEKCMAGVGW